MEKHLIKIFETNYVTIYKGIVEGFANEIILKILTTDYPLETELLKFKNEYEYTNDLNIKGVRSALKLGEIDNKPALFLEYINGITFKKIVLQKNYDIYKLLEIAVKTAQILGEIHTNHIIHNDINSQNILLKNNKYVYIIDFGISTKYNLKAQSFSNKTHFEGTLKYMSPEQTGRVNRTVDYRTDLYSFGVVLYELFTGKLPFEQSDAMELIHAHIAKMPVLPHKINPEIPEILSKIILKLLAKNAEDRYQSAFGLKYDLAQLLNSQDFTNDFQLGEKDFSGQIIISEKLYGRKAEIDKLNIAFDNILQGSVELVLVSGVSGVGKSLLINEIQKPVANKNGLFITGAFDISHQHTPYYAIKQLFKDFVEYILSENNENLQYWEKLIKKALSDVGKVITDIIPELELIIGKQDDIEKLPSQEAKNRFNYVWSNFITAICKQNHPVVMFFDNMQFADTASLDLLHNILSNYETNYLLVIAAYKQTDYLDNDGFSNFLKAVENTDISIDSLSVENLKKDDINLLLKDTLKLETETKYVELSDLIFNKTKGNPFFISQFLKLLYSKNIITFDSIKGYWNYDIKKINNESHTDNVIDLLIYKIRRLAIKTQYILNIAACIGNNFNILFLSKICKKNEQETLKLLRIALDLELISPSINNEYVFNHSRIQQAVELAIGKNEKKGIHYSIGKQMLNNMKANSDSAYIFNTVNQLNYGIEIENDINKIKSISELNFTASQNAKNETAYKTAYEYITIAVKLLPDNICKSDYKKTIKIYSEYAELAYLSGEFEESLKCIKIIVNNSRTLLDSLDAHYTLLQIYKSQGKYDKLEQDGFELINKLGLKIPLLPTKQQVEILQKEVDEKMQMFISGKLHQLNIERNQEINAAFSIFEIVGPALMSSNQALFNYTILYDIKHFLRYKNRELTPTLGVYGNQLVEKGLYDEAYKYSKKITELLDSMKSDFYKPRIIYGFIVFVYSWKKNIRKLAESLYNCYINSLKVGDIEFASYTFQTYATYNYFGGKSLNKLSTEFVDTIKILYKYKKEHSILQLKAYQQSVENLTSNFNKPEILIGTHFDEIKQKDIYIKDKDFMNLCFLNIEKMWLSCLFGKYEQAYKTAHEIKQYLGRIESLYNFPLFHFYFAVSALQIYEKNSDKNLLIEIDKSIEKYRIWVKHSSENFLHKLKLIEAEKMRVTGNIEKARIYYDIAIQASKKSKFINEEAIIWEFAGQFYMKQKLNYLAEFYLQNAYKLYRVWGANSKLIQLEKLYPQYNLNKNERSINDTLTESSGTTFIDNSSFDFRSILKSLQAISHEIHYEKIIKITLSLAMENTGAKKIVVIQKRNAKFIIAAYREDAIEDINTGSFENIEKSNKIPLSIIKYAIRTKNPVILQNAFFEKNYKNDIYVKKHKLKSVLCYPALYKSKLTAIIYFENNLSPNIFTKQRLEIVNMLATQTFISLENANLYKNLEKRVAERTEELAHANKSLKTKNIEIEESHKHITASINYAKRIQQAMLPTQNIFKEYFSEHFILYKPRDIVSGDFYWAKEVESTETGDMGIVFAAADCTGHGVPGAFVSMLGITFLNEIVRTKAAENAGDALNYLRESVKNSLGQTGKMNEQKDGMDIALCAFDTAKLELMYAGAHNSIYIIFNDKVDNERITEFEKNQNIKIYKQSYNSAQVKYLVEIKADRQPIGVYYKEKPFTTHRIRLKKDDVIYAFSDGYVDQFHGITNEKFKFNRFRNILLSIADKVLLEQKHILEKTFNEWKGVSSQIDDVLIMGMKV